MIQVEILVHSTYHILLSAWHAGSMAGLRHQPKKLKKPWNANFGCFLLNYARYDFKAFACHHLAFAQQLESEQTASWGIGNKFSSSIYASVCCSADWAQEDIRKVWICSNILFKWNTNARAKDWASLFALIILVFNTLPSFLSMCIFTHKNLSNFFDLNLRFWVSYCQYINSGSFSF